MLSVGKLKTRSRLRALETKHFSIMNFQQRWPSAELTDTTDTSMRVAGPVSLCDSGQMFHPRWNSEIWETTAVHWHTGNRYRVKSFQWFPAGTVLQCLHRMDVDCWIVDPQRTILMNGLSQDWLDDNEPGSAVTLPLF